MKEILDRRVLVKMVGWREFEDTSIFRHVVYADESLAEKEISYCYNTFDELKKAVENGMILNAESTFTVFKKPMVTISTARRDTRIKITEKNFKPVEVKVFYDKEDLSIKTIASLLKAHDFCEYLKDRGLEAVNLYYH